MPAQQIVLIPVAGLVLDAIGFYTISRTIDVGRASVPAGRTVGTEADPTPDMLMFSLKPETSISQIHEFL